MKTVTEPTAKQQDMKHIVNTTQRSTARQIQTISRIPNMFSNNEWSHKMVTEFPCPMQSQVLSRQQNLVANCIFNMPMVCIGVLLLVRLCLQQMTLHQLTKFLPTLYLILRSLYGMQTIQVVHRHAQCLAKCNMRRWQHSGVLHSAVHCKLNQCKSLHPILSLVCKHSYNLLNGTILPLSLTVSLRVLSASEYSSHTKQTP